MSRIIRRILLIITSLVVFTSVLAGNPPSDQNKNKELSKVIGLQYGRQFPIGYAELGGGMIDEGGKLSEYFIEYVQGQKNQMIWLVHIEQKDKSGNVSKCKVVDAIVLPKLLKNELVVWRVCSFNDVYNTAIVGLINNVNLETHKAWKTNLKTLKIEEISPENIACGDMGPG